MVAVRRVFVQTLLPSGARWQIFFFSAIVFIALIIPLIKLKKDRDLLSAQVAYDTARYENNWVTAGAIIAGSEEGELNSFVLKNFGAAAECYWSEKLIVCTNNTLTLAYSRDDNEHHRELLVSDLNACRKYVVNGVEKACQYLRNELVCVIDAYTAVSVAYRMDVGNDNGVNYLSTFKNVIKFSRQFQSTGCGDETVTFSRDAGNRWRPDGVKWYVGSGGTCSVVDTFLVEVSYSPGIKFGTQNTFMTPKISKLVVKGYDVMNIMNTVGGLIKCVGSELTTCTLSAPVTAKLTFSIGLESLYKIIGYDVVFEVGLYLRRVIDAVRSLADCEVDFSTLPYMLTPACNSININWCKNTDSST